MVYAEINVFEIFINIERYISLMYGLFSAEKTLINEYLHYILNLFGILFTSFLDKHIITRIKIIKNSVIINIVTLSILVDRFQNSNINFTVLNTKQKHVQFISTFF